MARKKVIKEDATTEKDVEETLQIEAPEVQTEMDSEGEFEEFSGGDDEEEDLEDF